MNKASLLDALSHHLTEEACIISISADCPHSFIHSYSFNVRFSRANLAGLVSVSQVFNTSQLHDGNSPAVAAECLRRRSNFVLCNCCLLTHASVTSFERRLNANAFIPVLTLQTWRQTPSLLVLYHCLCSSWWFSDFLVLLP